MDTYLLLDIGGSAIKYAYSNIEGDLFDQGEVETPLTNLDDLIEAIDLLKNKKEAIKGIAISMPGVIDTKKGIAHSGGALMYIKDIPLVQIIEEKCGVPVTIGNDAKCAGQAELGFGALQGCQEALVLVLGTGIGGCVIIDGKVHHGKNFAAGEVSCVKTNGQDALNQRMEFCRRNGRSGLSLRVQEVLLCDEKMNGKEIFSLALDGNEKVLEAIDLFSYDIAVQIFNFQALLDFSKVAIGGGISKQPLLIESIQSNVNKLFAVEGHPLALPEIVSCKYFNDANLLGALYQFKQDKMERS